MRRGTGGAPESPSVDGLRGQVVLDGNRLVNAARVGGSLEPYLRAPADRALTPAARAQPAASRSASTPAERRCAIGNFRAQRIKGTGRGPGCVREPLGG